MAEPTVFVLTRTSGRPRFFEGLKRSMKLLTYPNIIHIVHTDDPRDTYVDADIIIRGESEIGNVRGNGPYNLYNNRLMQAVPYSGWIHFMDDDDEYVDSDCFEKLLKNADPKKLQIGKVQRWPVRGYSGDGEAPRVVFPKRWGTQKSFQTECFLVHTSVACLGEWPSSKGGDHAYSKRLTRKVGCNWVKGVTIARAQEAKGHGRRLDMGRSRPERGILDPQTVVVCKRYYNGSFYRELTTLEKAESYPRSFVTFNGIEIEYRRPDLKPPKPPELRMGLGLSIIGIENKLRGSDMVTVNLHNRGKRTWRFEIGEPELVPGATMAIEEKTARRYAKLYPRELVVIADAGSSELDKSGDLESREKRISAREKELDKRERDLDKREAEIIQRESTSGGKKPPAKKASPRKSAKDIEAQVPEMERPKLQQVEPKE